MCFGNICFNYINNNFILKKQFELYLLLKNTDLSIENYFNEQEIIDINIINNSTAIKWKDLKDKNIKAYEHEKEHYKIFKKHKIKSRLLEPYAVIDINFREISKKQNYDKDKIITILLEMLIAPYKNKKDDIFGCSMDIVFYEVLKGNLKQFNKEEFKLKLRKYKTTSYFLKKGNNATDN